MDRRIEQEILAELALTIRTLDRDRALTDRIREAQGVLQAHTNARGWRAFLDVEELTAKRAERWLRRAIRIAFRRGLCIDRDTT